jgi:hypothetical protein
MSVAKTAIIEIHVIGTLSMREDVFQERTPLSGSKRFKIRTRDENQTLMDIFRSWKDREEQVLPKENERMTSHMS